MMAVMRSRRAPCFSMAAMVASLTPASAPFQPAWAAPMTPASAIGEENGRAIGGEDGNGEAGLRGHDGIALGRGEQSQGASATIDIGAVPLPNGEQIVAGNAKLSPTVARFLATVGLSSPEPKPQLSEAKRPDEWPPWRVKKPCRRDLAD